MNKPLNFSQGQSRGYVSSMVLKRCQINNVDNGRLWYHPHMSQIIFYTWFLVKWIILISSTDGSTSGPQHYEIVYPQKVDSVGSFLSYLVSHRASRVQRRHTGVYTENLPNVYYQLQYGGQDLHFSLTLNPNLLAPGFLTERRHGGLQGSTLHSPGNSQCYFLGDVRSKSTKNGHAAISTCDGLVSLKAQNVLYLFMT